MAVPRMQWVISQNPQFFIFIVYNPYQILNVFVSFSDFTTTPSGSVQFSINLIACINVIIVDDDDIEVNQSFTIEIVQTSTNLVQIGTDNTATVFIIDDDRK